MWIVIRSAVHVSTSGTVKKHIQRVQIWNRTNTFDPKTRIFNFLKITVSAVTRSNNRIYNTKTVKRSEKPCHSSSVEKQKHQWTNSIIDICCDLIFSGQSSRTLKNVQRVTEKRCHNLQMNSVQLLFSLSSFYVFGFVTFVFFGLSCRLVWFFEDAPIIFVEHEANIS